MAGSPRSANQLLARQPAQWQASHLQPVDLKLGDILYEPGQAVTHVYFPTSGLLSVLSSVDPTHLAEVGIVGAEGLIGGAVAMGFRTSSFRVVVQGSGAALRMKAAPFRAAFTASPILQHDLFRFSHRLMLQVAQTAACNRFHVVTQRLARWLLMTRDRVGSNELQMTHGFLAQMLGVRRAGVTIAAGALQDRGIITYVRGRITIDAPAKLAAEACTCYAVVNALSRS